MNSSLGPLGDFPLDANEQNTAAQGGAADVARDTHLFTRQQIQKRSTSDFLPHRSTTSRSLPLEVLIQLDTLLDQAIQSMVEGKEPAILSPMMWDAVLILRRTGITCSELIHLETPSGAVDQGCVLLDASGSLRLLIKAAGTKANEDYCIPLHFGSDVLGAVCRQYLRISERPDNLGKRYLFRDDKGLLSPTAIRTALRELSTHLTYEGRPYVIATHQFRRTLAQNISVLSTLMGHTSPSVCRRYVDYRPTSFSEEIDRLREKLDKMQQDEEQPGEEEQSSQEGEQPGEEQENREE